MLTIYNDTSIKSLSEEIWKLVQQKKGKKALKFMEAMLAQKIDPTLKSGQFPFWSVISEVPIKKLIKRADSDYKKTSGILSKAEKRTPKYRDTAQTKFPSHFQSTEGIAQIKMDSAEKCKPDKMTKLILRSSKLKKRKMIKSDVLNTDTHNEDGRKSSKKSKRKTGFRPISNKLPTSKSNEKLIGIS